MRSRSRSDRSRLRRLRSRSTGRREARCYRLQSHRSRHHSRDRSPSDGSRSGKRSWQPGRSRWDRAEAVAASRNRGNSGLTVEPTPAVAGGSSALPTSSLLDLVSLSGPVDQRGVILGSFVGCWCHRCWGFACPCCPGAMRSPCCLLGCDASSWCVESRWCSLYHHFAWSM